MTMKEVYKAAMSLPDDSKASLAEQLVAYLETHIDPEVEPDDDDFDGGLTEARREALEGDLISHEEIKREFGLQ